ncbi:MAG: hypothetical protein JRF18_05815 [Deltaproteobacteria bacterium]|nr:hypothetical protein [Deltaproteobacteria bacterium]
MPEKVKKAERFEKRFGVIAVEKGFITPDQLFDALKSQVQDDMEVGSHRLIGEILCAHDAMTFDQVDQVLIVLTQIEQVFD